MKHIITIVIVSFVLILSGCDATEASQRNGATLGTNAAAGTLGSQIREAVRSANEPVWITYEVPVNDTKAYLCCFDSFDDAKKNNWRGGGCSLEGSSNFFSSHTGAETDTPASERTPFAIFLRAENGVIGELRMFSSDCRVDTGNATVRRLGSAAAEDSIRFLTGLVDEIGAGRAGRKKSHEDEAQHVIAAIAMHKSVDANPALVSIVDSNRDEELRGHAAFWLGMKGGSEGLRVLMRLVDSTPSKELREQAIAGIAQSELEEAVDSLLKLARHHKYADVREHALFWSAEKAGEKVVGELEAATEDPDEDVREMAVFSISRLPREQSVPKLIELARSHKSPGVREQALFWLGQSGDERALDFIEEILTR